MDTSTRYLGLTLPHPFVAGASPLGAHLDTAKRLEDSGAAAIVLHSLFEEQITLAESGSIHHRDPLDAEFAAALAPFPPAGEYPLAPDEYLEHVRRMKSALHIPVVASLNGATAEGWLRYGKALQQAGADALEVNFYDVVTDLNVSGVTIETEVRHIGVELKRLLRIPVAIKLSPFFSAFGNLARHLDEAGVDGLVIFNRFYQPDIDIRAIKVKTNLVLSTNAELLLRLRWLAILHGRVRASLIASGGIETPQDGIKALLAGAHGVQLASALLRHGPAFMRTMIDGLKNWMSWQQVESVESIRGRLSLANVADPSAFERANYIHTLHQWNK